MKLEVIRVMDDDGRVIVLPHADPGGHAEDVSLAVAGCPVGALWME